MKKLFFFITLLSTVSFNVYASWLSKNASLFGIELGTNISEYNQKNCLTNHNYSNLGLNNFLLVNFSDKAKTGPQWTNWYYTDSKLPVSSGCVDPKINNDDFFNFKVKIYPKTKEIYAVSAIYKRVYKYKSSELKLDPSALEFLIGDPVIDPLTGKPKKKQKKKYYHLDLSETQCTERSKDLIYAIIKSHRKKGFKFDDINSSFFGGNSFDVNGGKRKNSNKNLIFIKVDCTIEGRGG